MLGCRGSFRTLEASLPLRAFWPQQLREAPGAVPGLRQVHLILGRFLKDHMTFKLEANTISCFTPNIYRYLHMYANMYKYIYGTKKLLKGHLVLKVVLHPKDMALDKRLYTIGQYYPHPGKRKTKKQRTIQTQKAHVHPEYKPTIRKIDGSSCPDSPTLVRGASCSVAVLF